VVHVPYNQLDALEAVLDEQIAAVVVEIVQGEGGVNMGTAAFLEGAQRLCRARGALLIIDEIQTGFGRTGQWFGFEHFALEPDIICLAKGLGGGFPMGAIAYGERVQAALFAGAHGSTFGGNPLACAAGLAAITTYRDENIIQRAADTGERLLERLRAALAETPVVREVRGVGMMIGIDLRQKPGPFLKKLMDDHGVLALPAGSSVLRLLPPLIAGEEEIELSVTAITEVLNT
jgi:acetylornithine/LysW-gamma-L-lysine aminotransferase